MHIFDIQVLGFIQVELMFIAKKKAQMFIAKKT